MIATTKDQHCNACEYHEDNKAEFAPAKEVLNPDSSRQKATMDDRDHSEEANCERLLSQGRWVLSKGEENIFAKYDTVASRKSQNDSVYGHNGRSEEFWPPIGELQINLVPFSVVNTEAVYLSVATTHLRIVVTCIHTPVIP